MIKNIDVNKIDPHPDNPRKNLGDLTELAESIKVNGVLQNLTVVPWFSSITRAPADDDKMDGYYVAVIGHRRLEAAKLAGLEVVPCAIVEMDYKKQLATMLLENIQRADLSVYEQAQGFQMMLDVGESVEAISQNTGFSESTVRRRVKLLELDKEKFKESEERGATLGDYDALNQIKDNELRNKVLEYIGTANFNYEFQQAREKERQEKNKADMLKFFDSFAKARDEIPGSDYIYVRYYSYSTELEKIEKPEDAEHYNYIYYFDTFGIRLYKEKEEETEEETEEEKTKRKEFQAAQEKKEKLGEISQLAYNLRYNFVKNLNPLPKHAYVIMEYAAKHLMQINYTILNKTKFIDMAEISLKENESLSFEKIANEFPKKSMRYLVLAIYCTDFDASVKTYHDHFSNHKENKELDNIYKFLELLGYQMSDAEKAMQNGTHEIFKDKGTPVNQEEEEHF